jgi:hypothetical protein
MQQTAAVVAELAEHDEVYESPEVRCAMEAARTMALLVARTRELEGKVASLTGEIAVANTTLAELKRAADEVAAERDCLTAIVKGTLGAWAALERIADREAGNLRHLYGAWAAKYGRARGAVDGEPEDPDQSEEKDLYDAAQTGQANTVPSASLLPDELPSFIREGRAAGDPPGSPRPSGRTNLMHLDRLRGRPMKPIEVGG